MDPSERFFRSLYEKQYEKMFKLAYRMTGSIEKTQDLVQNAFLLALFRKEELMVHPKPEGWLMTALKNLIFNERRRSESHPEVPLESVIESLSVNDPEMPLELALPKQLSKEDREILICGLNSGCLMPRSGTGWGYRRGPAEADSIGPYSDANDF